MQQRELLSRFKKKIKRCLIELYGNSEWETEYSELVKKTKVQCVAMLAIGLFVAIIGGEFLLGICLGCAIALLVAYLRYKSINDLVKLRRKNILTDLPRLINKISILLKCGMNLQRAFERAALSMNENSELGRVLVKVCNVFGTNTNELRVYEQLGRLGQVVELTRLSSILMQNSRKGNAELVGLINGIVYECYEKQKVEFKKEAEKKETLLLIPLVMLLIAVMLISVAPAMMSFGGGYR